MRKFLKEILFLTSIIFAFASVITGCSGGQGGNDTVGVKTFSEKYSKITVVYNTYGRKYETRAGEMAYDYLSKVKNDVATLVDSDDFEKAKSDEFVIYVGDVSQNFPSEKWDKFNKTGYYIEIGKGYAIARGSSAENTYYATSKLMHEYINGNLDALVTKANGGTFTEAKEVKREEYINNIDEFPLVWEYEWTSPEWMHDFAEKTESFPKKTGRVMVFGHRGDIEHYPENSIEGFISAIKKGADGIELDIWKTKDGVYVLNHAQSIAETTDWIVKKGLTIDGVTLPLTDNITQWTYAQLQKLNLRYGNGEYETMSSEITEYKIPTLEETLKVCKDRVYLSMDRLNYDMEANLILESQYFGLNNPYWNDIYGLMKKTNSFVTLYLNMALNAKDANDLRELVNREQKLNTITIFDRTGSHNCVIDWYGEFNCKDYDALYTSWITDGVTQGGSFTPGGSYIVCNRLTKAIDYVDKHYGPNKNNG